MLSICSSVQDHNLKVLVIKVLFERVKEQRNLFWSLVRLRKVLLKMTSSEATPSEAWCVWRKELLNQRHQKPVHQKLLHQKLKSVDKVQCTKCTTTNSKQASATTISAFLSPLQDKNNSNVCRQCSFSIGMDLKLCLHRTIIKSGKRSMVKNQSFSKDKLMYRLVFNISQILYK